MARGRPRKPVELHQLEGTYRPDRHGDVLAQIIPTGAPIKPRGLSEVGGKLWDTVVQELASQGVAKHIDTVLLGEMCQWYGRYRRAADAYDAIEPTVDGARALQMQVKDSWHEFDGIALRFGLTPADRAKLRITDTKTADSGVMVRKRA